MLILIADLNWADYTQYLPYAVGLAVALVILGFILVRRPKRRTPDRELLKRVKRARAKADAEVDSHGNRRNSVRRDGKIVSIQIASPSFRNKVEHGYVLDRSTGGMRIALSFTLNPGSAIQVRATNAPENIPWTTIIIRSCRNAGEYYELGCEFEQTPPWNELLLFG